jgi:hypothetical protein
MGRAPRAVTIRPLVKVGFKDRLQDELESSLDHPVPHRRNRQDALAVALALRYCLTPVPRGLIRAIGQFVSYLLQEWLHSRRFAGLERHPIDTWRAVVFFSHPVGFVERFPFADMDVEAPEAPRRFSLRLGVYPPSQVLQTDGRLSHLAPASRIGGGVTGSRVPWLHGSYPASPLLRPPPPPSRLQPTSRRFPVIRPTLLRRFRDGTRRASPVASRVLVTVRSLPPRRSDGSSQPDFAPSCCLRPPVGGSASGVPHFRGHCCVRVRYGPVTRCHPEDATVDGLQRFGFPPPCHPRYKVSSFCLGGTVSR